MLDIKQSKIGRNDACFCKSGRKFKKCCMNKGSELSKEIASIKKEIKPQINTENLSTISEQFPMPSGYKFFSYQITTDALYNEDDSCFSEKDAKIFANIEQKLRERQTEFNTYIMELEKLKKRYPEERRIYNLLGVCYGKKKDSRKTFEVLTEQYKKFPDYLFARVNLATWMIREDKHEKVKEIFEGKFDLKLMYPERNIFHISEASCFMSICGRYFVLEGEITKAKTYLDMLLKFQDPRHESVQMLERDIELFFLKSYVNNYSKLARLEGLNR